jgi:glycosyltransferase involved in cell wall biosynthesis
VRVVIDGLAIRGENSLSIVSEHLLAGWHRLESGDELHLALRADAGLTVPESVTVHSVSFGRSEFASRLAAQSTLLPRLCRTVKADVMLGVLPATSVAPLPCPRAVVAWDFRYRARPEQFSHRSLALRRLSYAIGYRLADAVVCISERTRRDALALHPRLSSVPLRVAHLGADHVDTRPVRRSEEQYAIAFGHFSNKNVELVLTAWSALMAERTRPMPLRVVGVGDSERARLERRVGELGLTSVVTVCPWLAKETFREQFASSSLVVFPSDFEGFGLPAVEAMQLGIPVVVTPEPALLEVTAGHATVVEGDGPGALARAVTVAVQMPDRDRHAAQRHAGRFTWGNFASGVRSVLAEACGVAETQERVAVTVGGMG